MLPPHTDDDEPLPLDPLTTDAGSDGAMERELDAEEAADEDRGEGIPD